jgi:hypothetical protein
MVLTFLSALPETTGLLIVGLVLILAGVLLRRAFVVFDNGIPASGHNSESNEQSLK